MKSGWLVFAVIIVSGALMFGIGCQEQAKIEAKPAVPQPIPQQPQDKSGPMIILENAIYDFGDVGPNSRNSGEFNFTNTGDELLKIERVKSTCGCTVPELKKKEYAPGESGTIAVQFKAPKHSGGTSKRLYIYSNAKNSPRMAMTIKAKVIMKVTHTPERLNLSLKEENAGCPNITVTSIDKQPFAIKNFDATGKSITAEFDPLVESDKFVLEPKVDIERLRTGLNGSVNIELTHPECPKIAIPFSALSEFKLNPPTIMVLKAEPQKTITREIWVQNNYNQDFEIASTTPRKGIMKVVGQQKDENGYKLKVEITPPEIKDKKRFFTDAVMVNIKGGETLKITCRGFYSKEVLK